ncbi:MAG: YbhB/YbcL family Raf kinase inhibitor-like protein [Reyranellaceae bacterium]
MASSRLFLSSLCAGLWSVAAMAQGGFAVTPTWEGIRACSGQPIASPSPAFSLTGVPAGTTELEFRMVDLDAPRFNHGGGKVRYTGQARIAPGAFQFTGPCPPQTHRYEWTVVAHDASGKSLATARAIKSYP